MSLLQMSLAGGGMVLVILVVRALTARRLPRLTFQVLWVLAALRLLLPLAMPLPVLPTPQPAAVGGGGGASTAQTRPDLPAWEEGLEVEQAPDSMAAPDSEGPTGYSDAPALGGGWRIDPLRTIWMAGAVVLALYFLLAYWRGMRLFRACPEEDAPAVRAWLDGHRLRRRVEVRAAPWIEGPLTCGVLRPMILLPQGLACGETGLLDDVLTHEWVHIRRFDGAAKLLFAAAVCVHWFNPLAWVLFVLANRDVELSCDQQVLRILGRERRGGYARALLQMEESRAGSASFYNHFGKHIMKERIEAIMKYKKTSVAAMILALVLVAGTATAFATVPVEQAAAPAIQEEGQSRLDQVIEQIRSDQVTSDEVQALYDSLTEEEWEELYDRMYVYVELEPGEHFQSEFWSIYSEDPCNHLQET